MVPILQMWKLRLRGLEYLIQVSHHLMSATEEVGSWAARLGFNHPAF